MVKQCQSRNCPSLISVKSPQSGVLKIYSVLGILIGQQNIKANITDINIPLNNGMYVFEFLLDNGISASEKVVVNRLN
jgi:hypothetical protein